MFSLPYSMIQLLMDVETLLLIPLAPHLRILAAGLYPLTVLFLSLLIQTIFAMGRCCSLSTRSTRRNPRPIAPTATALPYTYSTSYPMLAFIYNIYYCHHQHVSLFQQFNSIQFYLYSAITIQLSLGALQSPEPETPLVQAQCQHGQEKTPC